MKEHYVSYSQAVKLKELGFDWKVNHCYYDDELNEICDGSTSNYDNCNSTDYIERVCSAPTLAQAQAWLGDCKGIVVIAEPDWDEEIQCLSDYLTGKWYFTVWKEGNRVRCNLDPSKEDEEIWLFDTYEQALSAGISNALGLLGKEVNNA